MSKNTGLTEDEWALLDDVADDWYGLWEVDWWFNAVNPDWRREQRSAYLIDLVQRGLLAIFASPADRAVLEKSVALEILQEPSNWLPPANDGRPVHRVSTTKAGVAVLKAAGVQRP